MTEPTQRSQHPTHSQHQRALQREDIWDRFIDELDRQGQAGSAADVLTPSTLDSNAPSGKRFGDLSREDIDSLSKIGSNMGRRGDVVKTIWEQTQQQLKQQRRGRS
jgi:hypothetical protein